MRILTLTNCPLDPWLGSGKTVLAYSTGLRALGHTVDVLEPADYEVWRGVRRGKQWRQAAGATRAVEVRLRESSYDLVEFYGGEFWLSTLRLAKRRRRPLIVSHTNGLELLDIASRNAAVGARTGRLRRLRNALHDRLVYRAFADADAFVSLCSADVRYVLKLGLYDTAHAEVVEPGLDREYLEVTPPQHRDRAIAVHGSWVERKGIAALSVAVAGVLRTRPDVRFDVFGTDGARETVLSRFPSELHHRIVVHPRLPTPDIAAGLARASVFLFPSRYEGFGLALAEAMACGCAPVTTAVGFAADLTDGHDALLCPPDDPETLERLTLRLLDDQSLRDHIGANAAARARRLRWDSNVQRLADLYQRWTTERAQRLSSH